MERFKKFTKNKLFAIAIMLASIALITAICIKANESQIMQGIRKVFNANIASGTSGTCSWAIDNNGKLTISPSNGTNGTLANMSLESDVPWLSYSSNIVEVYIESGVFRKY